VSRLAGLLRQFSWVVIGILLLSAVYLLPPDTSLAQVTSAGTLTACVPPARPPLVTGNPAAPGIDVEILADTAQALGVDLRLNVIPALGRDFDPRGWRITRAQCAIIAGGLVDSLQTRSFLEVSPAYARTGWVAIAKTPVADLHGRRVGVLANVQGFDRIALASHLRQAGAQVRLLRSGDELVSGIEAGSLEVGISEALIGEELASGRGWIVRALPPPLESYPLVFGLWKGDLTLKRAVVDALDHMRQDGRLGAILHKYKVAAGAP
jgi:polar amino acid transport system substrate-binding protein/cystine transport system substrate-binding protein/membrane-bound lytic murein transglycosylase F